MVHHRVDGVFEFEDFALNVYGDLFGQIASGNRRRHSRDIAHLRGQVAGHEIDVVGQIFPGARNTFDFGLAAELSFGADFASDAGHFGGERTELVHHGVDGVFEFEEFAAHVHGNFFGKVAIGDSGGDGGDVTHL